MELIVSSIIFMIFNFAFSKWAIKKSLENSILLMNISLILVNKVFSIINNDYDFNVINQILIITLVTILNNKKHQKISIAITTNCLISVCILIINTNSIIKDILVIVMLLLSVYIFSITSYVNKKSFKDIADVCTVFYIFSVCLNLFLGEIYYLNVITNVVNIFNLSIVLLRVINDDLIEINRKNINLKGNVQISSIQLERFGEKVSLKKEISSNMRKSLTKKQVLLEEISNFTSKSIIIIDDFEHISTKDKNFINIWTNYNSFKGSLSLESFLNSSIKDKDLFYKSFYECREVGNEVELEFEDNFNRYFIGSFSKLVINDTNMGIMCKIEDITYKRNAESKIKENDIKYKNIVDNIPYSILIVDDEDIIYNNNNYIDFTQELVRRRVLNSSENDEINLLFGDSNMILSTKKATFYDREGQKEVIALKDITEYRESIKNLKISKKRYKDLVDLIPEGIYTQDFENKSLSYINKSMFEIFGVSSVEEIDFEKMNEGVAITQTSNEKVKFIRKYIKDEEKELNIEVACMLLDINKKIKIVGIVRDISEQVKSELVELEIEKKKAEYKMKSEFFVNISHELKTPLNVISSSNQLLEILHKEEINESPNGIISNTVKVVKKYSNIIMGLVDNIMDLARLELNLYENEVELYNAVNLVEDLVIEFNNYIEKSDISIIFDTDEEERVIKVDAEYIERAISILLTLIVKYSYKESIINVDLMKKGDETLLIQIKNEGKYDYTKYINDRERRGLDIGLDIVNQIINIYDAKIDIKTTASKSIDIELEMKLYEDIFDYKTREKNQNDNDIYYRCLNI